MQHSVERDSYAKKLHSAEEIRHFNETKQYTLMATCVLESLLTDSNLTAASAKLWEYLYTKAIMNEKLCVKIRYKDLALKFNRTERTIKRYVENLKKNDYLHVEANYYNHGQLANTFYLKLPQNIIENVQNSKNRKLSSKEKHSDTLASSLLDHTETVQDRIIEDNIVIQNKNVDHPYCVDDKNVIPDHDISDTLKNNIKNNNILNNNVVVDLISVVKKTDIALIAKIDVPLNNTSANDTNNDLLHINEHDKVLRETLPINDDKQDASIDDWKTKIDDMNKQINSLFIKLGQAALNEKPIIFQEIRQLQAFVTSFTSKINKEKNQNKSFNYDKNNIKLLSSIVPGQVHERPLSESHNARIKKGIMSLIPDHRVQQQLYDEMVYAIRFGALKAGLTGELLSIPHAISIALKLLREKRWETPTQLKNNMARAFYSSISGINSMASAHI